MDLQLVIFFEYLQGRFYHWEAVSSAILASDDACSLICRGIATSSAEAGGGDSGSSEADVVEFRRMGRNATDGTRCRPQSLDMCIKGKCRVSNADLIQMGLGNSAWKEKLRGSPSPAILSCFFLYVSKHFLLSISSNG